MEQTLHIGQKLKAEAERLGLKPPQVAEFFGVKTPSVYDWYDHGRISRKHYPLLEAFSGKNIYWWLGHAEPPAMPQIHEPASVFQQHTQTDQQTRRLLELWQQLDNAGKAEILERIEYFVAGRRPHPDGQALSVAGAS